MTVEAMIAEHRLLARRISRRYFAHGLAYDSDDMEQEALIATWDAVRAYSPDQGVPLAAFVGVLVRRRLATIVRAARAQRRLACTATLHIDADPTLMLTEPLSTEGKAQTNDALRRVRDVVATSLSPIERDAVIARVAGRALQSQGVKDKRRDNALQRAKKKLASPNGKSVCGDCGHSWERHDPNGGYGRIVREIGGCSVGRCTCATVIAVAA